MKEYDTYTKLRLIEIGLIDTPDIKILKTYLTECSYNETTSGIGGGEIYFETVKYKYKITLEYELNGIDKIIYGSELDGIILQVSKNHFEIYKEIIEYLNKEILHEQYLRKFPTKNNEIKKGKI